MGLRTTGQAAHIDSAAISGKGPRGNRELSEDELKSVQNAIWLCGHHASLVDKHQGEITQPTSFTATRVYTKRALHTSWAEYTCRSVGWIA